MDKATRAIGRIAPKLHLLDLRRSGLSVLERLCLEEAILRHDPQERNWLIVGAHEPFHNRILRLPGVEQYDSSSYRNKNCVIVLGIGGKPNDLLNVDLVKEDNVLCLKRFTGGGTVVLDDDSILISIIGRNRDFLSMTKPYPREIMQWTVDYIYKSAFDKWRYELENNIVSKRTAKSLVHASKSCGMMDNSGKVIEFPSLKSDQLLPIPDFEFRENDYIMDNKKIAGNAQSIVKGGWIHHTSFLWDYSYDHMKYLTLPNKRPEYRKDRNHDDFLIRLKDYYYTHPLGKYGLIDKVKIASMEHFQIEEVKMDDALNIVDDELGGLVHYFMNGKCRTKVVEL